MRLDQAARSVFLEEFLSAFVLAMRYPVRQRRCSTSPHVSNVCAGKGVTAAVAAGFRELRMII